MKDTLLCGAEEPIYPNPNLYTFDPNTGEFAEDEIHIHGLNRYSIVFDGNTSSEGLSAVADFLIQSASPAYWLAVWDNPAASNPSFPGNARWMEKRAQERKEQGWRPCPWQSRTLEATPSMQVATLPALTNNLSGFAPIGYINFAYRMILLLGVEADPCALVQEKLADEVVFMSRTGNFTPSQSLLRWLAHENVQVAWPLFSPNDRRGIIVLRSQPFTERDLKKMGVTEVRRAEQAKTVWDLRYPSFSPTVD
jgi:hypothetical protein